MEQSQTAELKAQAEFQLCQTSQTPIVYQHSAAKKHLHPTWAVDIAPSHTPLLSLVFLQGMLAAAHKHATIIQSVLQTTKK